MESRFPKFRSDIFVASSAIFVSLATLAVYIYQARIMQNQLHTSVWPYVEWLYNNSNHELYVSVENKGIGPAIIKEAKITLDGKPMQNNAELFETLLGTTKFNFSNSTVTGRVMTPGETIRLFHVYDSTMAWKLDSLLLWTNAPHKFDLTITYCSVYNDCWESNGVGVKPVESR